MTVRGYFIISLVALAAFAISGGCAESSGSVDYSVPDDGIISYKVSDIPFEMVLADSGENYSSWDLVMHDDVSGEDVYAILSSPPDPVAGIIFVPGAGVPAEAHLNRSHYYAENGIAFLVVDVRGNGGHTRGYAMDLGTDFELFLDGRWPQYYLIARDISEARAILSEEYPGIPIYVSGSSNGGRYAAISAGSDPGFEGYFGVSTSGFGDGEGYYSGEALRFFKSVNPDTYVASISPRPVYILHAKGDEILPFSMGEELFGIAAEPKEFVALNGSNHGMSRDVDDHLIENILKP
ncbi:MAG: alpha/beta hydrolase [Methanomicrobiaceae archaeon]|nr:alpha/beta hydrolase [Methanomicrobiaceae archaeon]